MDAAVGSIRALDLNKETNMRRIGEAMSLVTEVTFELYDREPHLTPLFLRGTKRFKHHFE